VEDVSTHTVRTGQASGAQLNARPDNCSALRVGDSTGQLVNLGMRRNACQEDEKTEGFHT
jgi:hypothetical protein